MNLAMEQMDKGGSRYPGMSFEEGVEQTLRWMNGDSTEPPIEEDDDGS